MGATPLSSRERVRLALEHKETDKIPIAMICSGINEPARAEFGNHLKQKCGKDLDEYIDSLIDMGVDVLQALQFDAAGMDPVELKNRHGRDLCFEGGASVQKTLPFGTAEDVRQEVERLISVLGKDGGYIFGPSHAFQAGTPPENILAMFGTARHYYPFG